MLQMLFSRDCGTRRLTGFGRTKSAACAPHVVRKPGVVLKKDTIAYLPGIEPGVNEGAVIRIKVLSSPNWP